MSELLQKTRSWVIETYSEAQHLLKTETWLRQLHPTAPEAALIAALTHDMERAFPGPDSPVQDLTRGVADPIYNQAHSLRSVRIVGDYLRKQAASSDVIFLASYLISVHEVGGTHLANLVQAADSLSFLEVNSELFLSWIPLQDNPWNYQRVKDKFTWMFGRIQVQEAKHLAKPLYQVAMQRLSIFAP